MARKDERHFKRYQVDRKDGIRGSLGRRQELQVLNMSLTGLAVETTFPLRIGKKHSLKLTSRFGSVEIPAEARWCCLVDVTTSAGGETRNVYRTGLDFTEALGDQATEILDFMEGHIVIELDERLSGRFRPRGSAIRLDGGEFRVKNVSFSGMLVETDPSAPPPADEVLEIEVANDELPLKCAARVARVERRAPLAGDARCDVDLEFENLSIDDCLALDGFIRAALE